MDGMVGILTKLSVRHPPLPSLPGGPPGDPQWHVHYNNFQTNYMGHNICLIVA